MQISVSIKFFQAISSLELILELSRDVVLKEYDQNTHLQNDFEHRAQIQKDNRTVFSYFIDIFIA